MKNKLASLLVALTLAATTQLSAQNRITVEAVNNDISYYLDLKAVASVFGESRNLEDFERRLNDYDNGLSNLDLNGDGEIDYLRVVETKENNVHLVVIQAILDRDVFQDVATIVVERDQYRRSTIQVIGDPYIYGYNYIIEPVYYRTPSIISWFWGPRYYSWYSPYYWGYYPKYYRYRRPIEINLYLGRIHNHIDVRHHYRYNDRWHSETAYRMRSSVSRNDYQVRYPDRTFEKRNSNDVRNRASFDYRRSNDNARINNDGTRRSNTYQNGSRSENYNNRQNNSYNRSSSERNNGAERSRSYDNSRSNERRTDNNNGSSNVSRNENQDRRQSSEPRTYENRSRDNGSNRSASENRPARETRVNKSESRPTSVQRESGNSNERVRSESRSNRENRSESRSTKNESKKENTRSSNSRSDSRR
ncbi:MAG: hypothetical protein H6Q20_2041 [Bacteroidetes bacterium]|nr:hypothetical protein [Bacteroidota bacterium]